MLSLLLSATCVWASSLDLTFDGLTQLIREKNSKVQAAALEREASHLRTGSLARSFLPSLRVQGSYENFRKGRGSLLSEPAYGAELGVNLFNGGRDGLESQIRDLELQKKDLGLKRVFITELQEARVLFWKILFHEAQIELLQDMVKTNLQNQKSADRRIRSGVALETDRLEFEMKAIELKQELEESELSLVNLKKEFSVHAGLKPAQELKLKDKFQHEHDFESLLKHEAADHDFIVREVELEGEIQARAAKKEKRALWPQVEAFASFHQYNRLEEDFPNRQDREESTVGVRMTLNFSGVWESQKQASSLQKQALASEQIAEYKKLEIEAHLESEMSELRLLHDQVHEAETNIELAQKYYRLTLSEYARGVKNSPDVLGASEKLFLMREKRNQIIRDFQISKAHVLAKIGK